MNTSQLARINASKPTPGEGDRIIHCSDDAHGTIVGVAFSKKEKIVVVRWDDGEHGTYDFRGMQFIKRTGEWITFG